MDGGRDNFARVHRLGAPHGRGLRGRRDSGLEGRQAEDRDADNRNNPSALQHPGRNGGHVARRHPHGLVRHRIYPQQHGPAELTENREKSKIQAACALRGRLVCFIYVPLCRRVFVLHLRRETRGGAVRSVCIPLRLHLRLRALHEPVDVRAVTPRREAGEEERGEGVRLRHPPRECEERRGEEPGERGDGDVLREAHDGIPHEAAENRGPRREEVEEGYDAEGRRDALAALET